MIEKINDLLGDLEQGELEQIYRLIEAKKRTYHKPLAFLQEVMGFVANPPAEGHYDYEMQVTDDLRNRYGIVHGGVITTFIDTAMAETAFQLDGDLKKAVTLNLTVNFVKAGSDGRLRCRITPTQTGRKIALFSALVTDDASDVVATATGHFYKSAHNDASPRSGA